ncbi:MAG TPA: hypothetical protein VFV48_09915, partial [Pseudomonadales bacterium]|nr:hypothetical protein [Pseudomonadales bacterium]
EPENVQQMVNAIVRLADDASLREQIGKDAAIYVRENFDRETLALKMLDVLEQARDYRIENRQENFQR